MSKTDETGWRDYLTPGERREIRALERQIARGDKQAGKLRVKRRTIQNRATARRRTKRGSP